MSYADLREFVGQLEAKGDLKRIGAAVSPRLEMTEVCDRVLRAGGPALLFERPAGHDMPVLANLFGSVRRVVCASPAYIAAHGKPRSPEDLARFDTIGFSQGSVDEPWLFGADPKKRHGVGVAPRLHVNSAEVAIAAALAGWGFTRVLSYMIAPEVRAGRLKVVLTSFEPPRIPISLVYREGRKAAAKVRAFVDFAAARLRANRALA